MPKLNVADFLPSLSRVLMLVQGSTVFGHLTSQVLRQEACLRTGQVLHRGWASAQLLSLEHVVPPTQAQPPRANGYRCGRALYRVAKLAARRLMIQA